MRHGEGLEYGPRARLQPAPQRSHDVEGQIAGDLDRVPLVGQGVGGERGLAEEVTVWLSTAGDVETVRAVQAGSCEVGCPDAVTVGRVRRQARLAAAARVVGEDDVVTGLDGGDGDPHAFDDSSSLVPQHHRQRRRHSLRPHVSVGRAYSGRDHANEYLVGPRVLDLDVVEFEGPVLRFENSGARGGGHTP